MVAVDTNNIQDETSDGGGDGFNAFLDIVYSPTSKSNDDVDIEQRSETSTTNSHTAFIDYLKSPDKTPAPPPSPKKKAASSSVACRQYAILAPSGCPAPARTLPGSSNRV